MDEAHTSLARHRRGYNPHNRGVYQVFALSVRDVLVSPLPLRAKLPFEPTPPPALQVN